MQTGSSMQRPVSRAHAKLWHSSLKLHGMPFAFGRTHVPLIAPRGTSQNARGSTQWSCGVQVAPSATPPLQAPASQKYRAEQSLSVAHASPPMATSTQVLLIGLHVAPKSVQNVVHASPSLGSLVHVPVRPDPIHARPGAHSNAAPHSAPAGLYDRHASLAKSQYAPDSQRPLGHGPPSLPTAGAVSPRHVPVQHAMPQFGTLHVVEMHSALRVHASPLCSVPVAT